MSRVTDWPRHGNLFSQPKESPGKSEGFTIHGICGWRRTVQLFKNDTNSVMFIRLRSVSHRTNSWATISSPRSRSQPPRQTAPMISARAGCQSHSAITTDEPLYVPGFAMLSLTLDIMSTTDVPRTLRVSRYTPARPTLMLDEASSPLPLFKVISRAVVTVTVVAEGPEHEIVHGFDTSAISLPTGVARCVKSVFPVQVHETACGFVITVMPCRNVVPHPIIAVVPPPMPFVCTCISIPTSACAKAHGSTWFP